MADDALTCALCQRPADDRLRIGTQTTHYSEVPLCNGHLAAFRLGDWWLTIRLMEQYATVGGSRLSGLDDGVVEGP